MDIKTAIKKLDEEWDQIEPNGFFVKLKQGQFDQVAFDRVVTILNSVELPQEDFFNKRFVELVWFIPTFMRWQQDGLRDQGTDLEGLDRAISFCEQRLTTILGLP